MTNSSFENNIGIIGLGVLGSAIAENFINKNISINGFDINKKVFEWFEMTMKGFYEITNRCQFEELIKKEKILT